MCNGGEHPEGALYIGEGCMGEDARRAPRELRPYLADVRRVPHFCLIEVVAGRAHSFVIDETGNAFANEALGNSRVRVACN